MISPRNIVMLRRQRRYRNYLAWRLIQEDARQQTQLRDEQRRHYLRHVIDPMDITVEELVKRYRLTKEAFIHLCNELSSQVKVKIIILSPAVGSPQAKFNSVHCRTRVIIENTFGILKNRWRCLSKDRTLHYAPRKCAKIITACAVLHNIAIDFRIPVPEDVDTMDNLDVAINDVLREAPSDDLSTGRALRSVLVDKINVLHRHH